MLACLQPWGRGEYTKIVITMTIAMAHCDTMTNCNITHPKHWSVEHGQNNKATFECHKNVVEFHIYFGNILALLHNQIVSTSNLNKFSLMWKILGHENLKTNQLHQFLLSIFSHHLFQFAKHGTAISNILVFGRLNWCVAIGNSKVLFCGQKLLQILMNLLFCSHLKSCRQSLK